MKHAWCLILMCGVMMLVAVEARAEFNVYLEVVDSSGNIIPRFEVTVFTHEGGLFPWKEGKDGQILLRSHAPDYFIGDGATNYDIIIRAQDYAPSILRLNRPEGNIERTNTLNKGLRVELMLTTADGRPIPESLVPTVIFPEYQSRVWSSFQTHNGEYRHRYDFNMTSLVKTKPGHYVFNIPEDSPEIYVFIDHPGFLRAFRAGPFTVKDMVSGKLKIELPKPAKLEIVFDPPKDWVGDLPYAKCSANIWRENPENEKSGLPVAFIRSETSCLHMNGENFAPGNYWVMLNTLPSDDSAEFVRGQINPAYFRDMKKYSLCPGQVEKVIFKYTPYDENSYKGDYSATVSIRWHNGKPAVGVSYTLYYEDKHFWSVIIEEGTIPENGQIKLTGLAGGDDAPHFTLEIDKGKLGRYLLQLLGEEKKREIEYKIAPLKGSTAPDITLLDIFSGEEVKLSDYKGKIVFIEFWSTGCGPCQGPTAKLCEIASKRKDDWANRALLLCVSIDEKKEHVINHVRTRGWLAVRHLWCHKGEPGWKSDAAKKYGITGVPTALLIDQSGHIVWRGHPASFDIEANIDRLLGGKQERKK